jgi:hypothetical protein
MPYVSPRVDREQYRRPTKPLKAGLVERRIWGRVIELGSRSIPGGVVQLLIEPKRPEHVTSYRDLAPWQVITIVKQPESCVRSSGPKVEVQPVTPFHPSDANLAPTYEVGSKPHAPNINEAIFARDGIAAMIDRLSILPAELRDLVNEGRFALDALARESSQ